jgi:ectoine hydroxylase
MRQFVTDGYMILKKFIPQPDVDALNNEVQEQLSKGEVGFNFTGRKIFNFHEKSQLANTQYFRNPELLRMMSFLLGRAVVPFQSLNFILGSEQRPHSDLIHMTTEPQGYLIAAWFALEPCTPENGALTYYPGSHKLPFISTQDYDSGNTYFTIGDDSNKHYEDKIESVIAENKLQPAQFLAETGDVLIWHANLLHAGSPITSKDPNTTRKSMVCHYYGQDVICYHEMSQRPALF